MRVTDLSRKLGLTAKELRDRLAEFGVSANAQEIENEKAQTIFIALKGGKPKPEPVEEERELMGFVFETTDKEEKTPEEIEPEEAEPEDSEEEDESDEEEDEEDEEEKQAKPKVEIPKPKTEKKKTRAEREREVVKTIPVEAGARRTSVERDAARARWAAAKKASEVILTKKIKEMERERKKKLEGPPADIAKYLERESRITTVQTPTGPKREIQIADTISVKELAEKMSVSPVRVVAELFRNGIIANLNQSVDYDTAAIVAEVFNCVAQRDLSAISGTDLLAGRIEKLLEDDAENLSPRPPIVAVMGHVDHGKTSLLDAVKKSNVAGGESGGITQHIGAYQVVHNDRKITFLDTPGHEAFTAIRARGARATDIAVLVVAADDGVKPQTLEALDHAREAGVPIIVALTKIDKPGAQIERVKGELAALELVPSDWGGKTEMVGIASPTGEGIDQLLEIILLVNDLDPVLANSNRTAVGTVIESHLDKSLGPVATVLVNTGTLRVGDNFIIGPVIGRVKKMLDWKKKSVKVATPGMPVQLAGIASLPERGVGEILQVFATATAAKEKSIELSKILSARSAAARSGMSNIIHRINAGELKELKLVVKADVEGSLEALRGSLGKIGNENVKAKIIHGGVGDVSETDVVMAGAADGLVLAFHVKVPSHVENIAEREGVTIRRHTIIYKLIEEIEKMLSGMLDPEEVEVELGTLEVRGVFLTKEAEQIIGGMVKTGKLLRNVPCRVIRDGAVVAEGKITGLKREKEDVGEVKENFECGLKVALKNLKIKEGDIIQAYRVEKHERTL